MTCFDAMGKQILEKTPQRCNKNAITACHPGRPTANKLGKIVQLREKVDLELACVNKEIEDERDTTAMLEYKSRLLAVHSKLNDHNFKSDPMRTPRCRGSRDCHIFTQGERASLSAANASLSEGNVLRAISVGKVQSTIADTRSVVTNSLESCAVACRQETGCLLFSYNRDVVPPVCILTAGQPCDIDIDQDDNYRTYSVVAAERASFGQCAIEDCLQWDCEEWCKCRDTSIDYTAHGCNFECDCSDADPRECPYPASSIQSVHHSGAFTTISEPNAVYRPSYSIVTENTRANDALSFYADVVFASLREIRTQLFAVRRSAVRCELDMYCEDNSYQNEIYDNACMASCSSQQGRNVDIDMTSIGFEPGLASFRQEMYTLDTVNVIGNCVQLQNETVVCDYSERGRLAVLGDRLARVCDWVGGKCLSSGAAIYSAEWYQKCLSLTQAECSRDAEWQPRAPSQILLRGTLLDANDHGVCITRPDGQLYCQHKDISSWEYYPPKLYNVDDVSLVEDRGACAIYNDGRNISCWGVETMTKPAVKAC